MAHTIVDRLRVNPDHYGSEGGMSLNKNGGQAAKGPGGKQGGCC